MLFIGLIVALAAALWFTLFMRWGGLVGGCLLVIFTGSVLGHSFFHVSVVTLDRILWAVLVGLYVIRRVRGELPSRPVVWMDWLLLCFLGVLTANTLIHDWKVDGAQPASRLLFLYLMPAALYWISSQISFKESTTRATFVSAAVFGIYLSATAIAEVLHLRPLVFPPYILSEAYPEFLGRGRGPYLNPSANGIYIGTCLAAMWMYWPYASKNLQKWIVAASCLCFAGALATLTRCVWLAVGCGTMLVMWLTFPRQKRMGLTILIISVGALGLGTQWENLVAFKRDKNVSVSDMAKSAKLRPMLAVVAWQMFSDNPLLGVGFGQYKHHDDVYIARRMSNLPLDQVRPYHQHNVVLSLLTEVGLSGTLPYLLMMLVWIRRAVQLWFDEQQSLHHRQIALVFLVCVINYLINGMFQDVALIPMVNLVLFFCAGQLSSAAKSTGIAREPVVLALLGNRMPARASSPY